MTSNVSSLQGSDGRALGLEIIDQLTLYGLAVSAANYELWLAYRLLSIPDLTRKLDAARANNALTQTFCDALYEDHFATTRLSVQMLETGDSIARELAEVLDCLRTAGEQTRAYGDTLNAAERLEGNDDPALFRKRVRELVAATRHMAAHNQAISAQMAQSAAQVESLQAALTSVKVEALTDGLTGLGNRRLFEATLNQRLGECGQSGEALSLILGDIDHFKRINDGWGHPVGDQVIRFVAHVLKRVTPKEGLVARYGGEEFAIILPRMNSAGAAEIAEAARLAVSAQRISKRSSGQLIGAVTVSFGVAERRPHETAAALLERADQNLYAAKSSGRDRVVSDAAAQAAA